MWRSNEPPVDGSRHPADTQVILYLMKPDERDYFRFFLTQSSSFGLSRQIWVH